VDGRLELRDGRTLAWREWGLPDGTAILKLQGTPGSRLSRYPHLDLWERLGLRVIMADRPGYGDSSRLPGRGVSAIADDLVELLDHLNLGQVPVIGQSGGGPHVLALCAGYPDRVLCASVVVGAAPITDEDVPLLVGLNRDAYQRMRAGGWEALHQLLARTRDALLADPVAGLIAANAGAPESDQVVMHDPAWQTVMAEGIREALRPGAEGWADESLAILADWDFRPAAVTMEIVWWHGRHDANAPLQAVERLLAEMPSVDLRVWSESGHLETFHRETEILRELMARC
jgi:pimeloyl-ACP methyl ester carboxylesterase